MKILIKQSILFIFFLLSLSYANAESKPSLCEAKFIKNNYKSEIDVCSKVSWSKRKIAKIKWKSYFTCLNNLKDISIPNDVPHLKCLNSEQNDWLKSSEFATCTQSLSSIVQSNQIYNLCKVSTNADIYNSSSFGKCFHSVSDYLGNSNSAFHFCSESPNLKAFEDTHFNSCKAKLGEAFSKYKSLQLCIKPVADIKYIASADFDSCLEKASLFTKKEAYLLCLSEDNIDEVEDPKLQKCLQSGLAATKFDYYLHKHLELQKVGNQYGKNEFQYLFKDCHAEHSFFFSQEDKSKDNSYIKYHSDYNIHSSTRNNSNFLLGGFSALRFDTTSNSLYLLSDDRGVYGPARLHKYKYSFEQNNQLVLIEEPTIQLTSTSQDKLYMDPEGFDLLEDGNLIISSELDDLDGDDFITIYDQNGSKQATVPLHDDFKPKSITNTECKVKNGLFNTKTKKCKTFTKEKGFQSNKSLESLSLSPDKLSMFVANEQALHQDKRFIKSWGITKKIVDHVRIAKYEADTSKNFKEVAQYYYQLSSEVDNGLVDILSIDENKLLTLERSWNHFKKKITARIYYVDLNSGENILASNNYKAKPVTKKLLVDLSDIEQSLSPGFRLLENFEGMSFGPTLPNGRKSLVLVTDNNFNSYQRTLLLFLELNLIEITK